MFDACAICACLTGDCLGWGPFAWGSALAAAAGFGAIGGTARGIGSHNAYLPFPPAWYTGDATYGLSQEAESTQPPIFPPLPPGYEWRHDSDWYWSHGEWHAVPQGWHQAPTVGDGSRGAWESGTGNAWDAAWQNFGEKLYGREKKTSAVPGRA